MVCRRVVRVIVVDVMQLEPHAGSAAPSASSLLLLHQFGSTLLQPASRNAAGCLHGTWPVL